MCAKKLSTANKIAVAVATVAVAGSFGTGVYAAVQGTPEFDAKGFESSYNKGAQDEQKGFKATQASSDSAANRHKDDANSDDKSAQNNSQSDAFSNLPDNGSGTTAVSVDPNAKPGTTTRTDDGNGDGAGDGGASGPAADDNGNGNGGSGDNPGGGDNSGGNDNPGGGDNTGGNDNPGGGDTPGDKPGDNNNPGGGNDKPDPGNKPSVNPGDNDNPGGGTADVPQKPEEDRGNTENPFTPEKEQVGEDSYYKPGGSGPASEDIQYFPDVEVKEGYAPCVGEKVSSWDLFCSLDTVYFSMSGFNFEQYMWSCSDEKAYKDYDLFQITGISYQDPDDPSVTKTIYFADQDKITIPDCPFDILYTYRFYADDVLKTGSLSETSWPGFCTPAYARVYLVQDEKTGAEDAKGGKKRSTQKVVKSYTIASKGEYINFADQAKTLLENEGVVGDAVDKYGNIRPISKLITGFYDVDTGDDVDSAGGYSPTPGYHTVTATFDDVAEGTAAYLKSEYGDLFGDESYYYAQILTHVDASKAKKGTFKVQKGIQAVQADVDSAIDTLELPDTVMRVGDPLLSSAGGARLTAIDNYVVDSSNKRLESVDGCIIDRYNNSLVAIPTGREAVTVSDGISMVDLPATNNLKFIDIAASSASALPDFTFNNLDESCILEVATNEILAAAQEKYKAFLQNGNVIRSKEGTSKKLIDDLSMDVNLDEGELLSVPDNGAGAITLYDIKSIGTGAFAGNESVTTVFLKGIGDCVFEPGCFQGGAVKTVVCESDAQAELVRASMTANSEAGDSGEDSVVTLSVDGANEEQPITGTGDENPSGGSTGAPTTADPIEVLSVEHALTTDDGNFEYLEDGDVVILLKALNNNVTKFTGVLDNGKHVDVIGPEAFADRQSLRYLNLDKSVAAIGQKAFAGCTGLREVFFDTRDSLTFGAKSFYGCDNMELFVSNAQTAVGNTGTFMNDSCDAWCPMVHSGYDDSKYGWFDEASNITSYEAAAQSDGSFVLYGCTDDEPWLCITAPSELPAKVTLPKETLEIFSQAFAGAKGPEYVAPPVESGSKDNDEQDAGDKVVDNLSEPETEESFTPVNPFTVNLDELDNLLYIDESAFDDSALAGDVHLGERGDNVIHISRNGFNNCKNITSFTCDALYLDLGETALGGCSNMKTVKLACEKRTHADISAGAFGGCSSLESIEFTAETDPVELTKVGDGKPFKFTFENYEDKIKIVVPDGMKEAYLKSWVYSFTSYDDYDQLLEEAENDLKYDIVNPRANPTDAQIVQRANEQLLDDENYLRARLGMSLVEEPTLPHRMVTKDGVSLWVDDSNQAVIVKVAPGTESIDLTDSVFDAWDEVVLQKGAFASAGETLKSIKLSDKVKVIKKDTFEGCKDITLTLASSAPMLQGAERDNAFTFGAEKLKIEANDEVRDECLKEWPRQMVGLDTDWALDEYAFDVYIQLYDWENEKEPLKTEVSKAVNDVLLQQENTVRDWFEMELLAEDATPTWAYVSTYGGDPEPPEEPKNETPAAPGGNTGDTAGDTSGTGGNAGEAGGGANEVNPPSGGTEATPSEGDVDKKEDSEVKTDADKKDDTQIDKGADSTPEGTAGDNAQVTYE